MAKIFPTLTLVALRLIVVKCTQLVGFITSNPENHLFTKVFNKGDVFVFLIGLLSDRHVYELNSGE
jgi:hypothetical protein